MNEYFRSPASVPLSAQRSVHWSMAPPWVEACVTWQFVSSERARAANCPVPEQAGHTRHRDVARHGVDHSIAADHTRGACYRSAFPALCTFPAATPSQSAWSTITHRHRRPATLHRVSPHAQQEGRCGVLDQHIGQVNAFGVEVVRGQWNAGSPCRPPPPGAAEMHSQSNTRQRVCVRSSRWCSALYAAHRSPAFRLAVRCRRLEASG